MSQPEITHDVTSLSNDALVAELANAESQEQALSTHRRQLHSRIDNLKVRGDDSPNFAAEMLATLRAEEREISERRLQLHYEITALRIEQGRRLASGSPHLSPVE